MKTLMYIASAFVVFFVAGATGLPGQLFTWLVATALTAAGVQLPFALS